MNQLNNSNTNSKCNLLNIKINKENNIDKNIDENIDKNIDKNNIDKNDIKELLKELEEESLNSINSNYFTEEEKKKINYEKMKYKLIYYIFLIIGFYLIYICNNNNYLAIFFEIILNLCYPYIFIPIKLYLCRNNFSKICIPLKF